MKDYNSFGSIVEQSSTVLIVQADNPDGDSLGTTLALEAILDEMGKKVHLVCGVDIPAHLRYMNGWDRVQKDIPSSYDIAIMVDCNTESLLETLRKQEAYAWLKTKPFFVLDHHVESDGIPFAAESIVEPAVATGELLYRIVKQRSWPLPIDAGNNIAISIMSDSLGLTSDATSSASVRVIADLMDSGVSLSDIEQARRELMRKEPELLPYKGELLKRVTLHDNNRVAIIVIPWQEIEQYSPLYNPSMLVIDDMRLTVGVDVAIAFKQYRDGKVTAKIRCNDKSIASDLAAKFGGGGHAFASGFKIQKKTDIDLLIKQVVEAAHDLLNTYEITT